MVKDGEKWREEEKRTQVGKGEGKKAFGVVVTVDGALVDWVPPARQPVQFRKRLSESGAVVMDSFDSEV